MNFFTKLAQEAQKIVTQAERTAKELRQQTPPHLQDFAAYAEETMHELGTQFIATFHEASPHIKGMTDTVTHKVGETATHLKAQAEQWNIPSDALSLDEIGRKMASLGAPALAFAVAAGVASSMGLAGGAVVTTALALLGGPVGMVGGLVALGITTIIADAVLKYGIDEVLYATFKAKQEEGVSQEAIVSEIEGLWISTELRLKLRQRLGFL